MATNEHDHESERVREGQGPTKDKLRRVLDEAARDDEDRTAQQRNAGLAILVLAVVVVVLLLAIVSGATDAFQP